MSKTKNSKFITIALLVCFLLFVFFDPVLFVMKPLLEAVLGIISYGSYWLTPFVFLGSIFFILTVFSKKHKAIYFNILFVSVFLGIIDLISLNRPTFDIRRIILETLHIDKSVTPIDMTREPVTVEIQPRDYNVISEINGYAPWKGVKQKCSGDHKSQKIFNVSFTIDSSGIRKSPCVNNQLDESIVFFGCSMTFGFGLEDDQTIPYLVGKKANCHYAIYNFAYNGYGTHQMVSSLEHGLVDSVVKIPPAHIFYIGIPHHMERIVNNIPWGEHSPHYELNENSDLVYMGHFDDFPLFSETCAVAYSLYNNARTRYKQSIESRSFILRAFAPESKDYGLVHDTWKENLFIAMVKRAKVLSEQKFPDSKFHFIYYIYEDEHTLKMKESRIVDVLRAEGVDVQLLSKMLKDASKFERYCIKPPYEMHPNFQATDEVSDFIISNILRERID